MSHLQLNDTVVHNTVCKLFHPQCRWGAYCIHCNIHSPIGPMRAITFLRKLLVGSVKCLHTTPALLEKYLLTYYFIARYWYCAFFTRRGEMRLKVDNYQAVIHIEPPWNTFTQHYLFSAGDTFTHFFIILRNNFAIMRATEYAMWLWLWQHSYTLFLHCLIYL